MRQPSSDVIDVTVQRATTKATVTGDFDMQATFTIEPALEDALNRADLRVLELDLTGLDFVDSTGIGVLLRIDSEARERGVALRILPPPPEVHRIFELSGVAEALPFAT